MDNNNIMGLVDRLLVVCIVITVVLAINLLLNEIKHAEMRERITQLERTMGR